MRSSVEQYTNEIGIVVVGNLNPIVFQPAWFSNQKLLRAAEADGATVGVIHPDVTSFSTEWLSVQVTRDRFTAITKSDAFSVHLRDFVVGTFLRLAHTPVTQMGINCSRAFNFENADDWHNFGHYFTPKSAWFPFDHPGLLSVNMRAERTDGKEGSHHISVDYAGRQKAVIKINDHYDVPSKEKDDYSTAEYFSSLLASDFDGSIANSIEKIDLVFSRFQNSKDFDNGSN